jgi:hypothetical protein
MRDAKRRKISQCVSELRLCTDHIREGYESRNRELNMHEVRFPTWYPIGRKTMEKSTNSGISFDGIGGYFQGFKRGVENCKTFMRRFDPDPRLQ